MIRFSRRAPRRSAGSFASSVRATVELLETRRLLSATLQSFYQLGGTPDEYPLGLISDAAGDVYGTSSESGNGYGTVFALTGGPSILATFNGVNGNGPDGPVAVDSSGDLYGTTQAGGAFDAGNVYEVVAGSGAVTNLITFNRQNGRDPDGVVIDSAGNVYGTTAAHGTTSGGTVYEIAAGTHTFSTLVSFNVATGNGPRPLVVDALGNLYGVTQTGGANNAGILFEVAAGTHAYTTLKSFKSADGSLPVGLAMDRAGDFFVTTGRGGANNDGAVFEVAAVTLKATLLASFNQPSSGADPLTGPIVDYAGNVFGATPYGGTGSDGTVWELAAGSNSITPLVSFNGSNGNEPDSALSVDAAGNIYGATELGGSFSFGTVFNVTDSGFVPPPVSVIPPTSQSAEAGVQQTFNLGSFDTADDATGPYTVKINWGDGSDNTTFQQDGPGTLTGQPHTFTTLGQDIVTVKVTDSEGYHASATEVINVVAGPAVKMVFKVEPADTVAGQPILMTLKLKDAFGNKATGNDPISLSIHSGPSGASLRGTTTVHASNGIAVFDESADANLTLAGTYKLQATDYAEDVVAISAPFTITHAAAAQLEFVQQPSSGQVNKKIEPPITVEVVDQFGNLCTNRSTLITLSLQGDAQPITGDLSVNAVDGIATFSEVKIIVANAYEMLASAAGFESVTSFLFAIE